MHHQQERLAAAGAPVSPWGPAPGWLHSPAGTRLLLLAMLVSLAICYRASFQLPLTALGFGMFALLAMVRPDLGLIFVPLTVPLYLMPKGIWDERFGIRPEGVRFAMHELVLLAVMAATLVDAVGRRLFMRQRAVASGPDVRARLLEWTPAGLFMLAGLLGVAVASASRDDAWRELRWLVVEPVIFFGLVRYWLAHTPADRPAGGRWPAKPVARRLLWAVVLGGGMVGLLGLLQFAGLNLVPLLGQKTGFSDDTILVEGVRRVQSVYGHPNNLGLYTGRVWVLAAALVLLWPARRLAAPGRGPGSAGHRPAGLPAEPDPEPAGSPRWTAPYLIWVVCGLLALGGLLVSFSKGALLGALAAILALGLLGRRRWLLALAGGLLGLVLLAGLVLGIERLDPFGDTSAVRLKTWAAALAMIRDHPLLGVGLDQFLRVYPNYMHPSLAGTNEIYTSHPHNLVLDLWLRTGLPGLLAAGWLITRLVRVGLQGGALQIGIAAATVAALAHGLVDQFYFVPDLAFTFWLLLALRHEQ